MVNKANTKNNDEKESAPIMKSPIKRKVKYSSKKSKIKMRYIRENLYDESQENAKESAKKGMQYLRGNLDDESKENC